MILTMIGLFNQTGIQKKETEVSFFSKSVYQANAAFACAASWANAA